MSNIVVLQPDGKLIVIRPEDYSEAEHRYDSYVGPVGREETIKKGNEIAEATTNPQKER